MPADQSDVEVMTRALVAAINEAAKRRPMAPMQICAALGAAAAVVTAETRPECDEVADSFALGVLGLGYSEMLPILRKAKSN